jgi:lipopolysaccharide export system protein LptA
MWRTRPVLLLGIVLLLGLVGYSYHYRLIRQTGNAPKLPATLPADIASTAHRWSWKNTVNGKTNAEISADDMRQIREPNKFSLDGVELHIFNKEGDKFDLIHCAKADFDIGTGEMFSDGAVDITMNVPKDEQPTGRLMSIHSSGIHFQVKTGKAVTDRAATFEFDRGGGKAVGAEYDPQTRELILRSQVDLTWRGSKPKSPPMHIEAGELRYRESESKVFLSPWSRLTRQTLTMNGGSSVVTLNQGTITLVEAENATGTDKQPTRSLDFAAQHMVMNFDDDGQISSIDGQQNAHLTSVSANGRTNVTTDNIKMLLEVVRKGDHSESKLKSAIATGHGVLDSHPAAQPGKTAAPSRVLSSELITMTMRPGGEDVQAVETGAPGTIEFLPSAPTQSHRLLTGDRIWITYGEHNEIQTFRSINVTTRTDRPKAPDAKLPPPPALTWSKDLNATFEPKTNDISKLEQWNNFRYESGDRRATAERASIDQAKNVITLTKMARVWDSTGSTSAAQIVMDQKNSNMVADGDVNSVRLPDKENQPSGMLSADEPLHARAKHMESRDNNMLLLYKGDAVTWQGANRLEADVIEVDRENSTLKAHTHVVSELLDKNDDKKKTPQGPVFTVVKSADMVYTDDDHIARYSGGATLKRPDLDVKGREIIAYLKENEPKKDGAPKDEIRKNEPKKDAGKDSGGSSLDHALADGAVVVVSTSPQRIRTGTSEHAEYYVEEGKVILTKGQPLLVDSLKGNARGSELTWYSKNDRLLINGVDKELAHSLLNRK